MSSLTVLLACVQSLLIQSITANCIGPGLPYEGPILAGAPFGAVGPYPAAGPYPGPAPYGAPFLTGSSLAALPIASGGGFAVSSASPIPPAGVSVISENAIEGVLAVGGELPFLGTVGLEGALPTAGAGAVAYGCGNGAVGMVSEDIAGSGLAYPAAPFGYGYGPALGNGFGYGPGFVGRRAEVDCGCGPI